MHSKVIPIAQALIEVMVVALQSADDSSGEIGRCVEHGLELLANSAPKLNKIEQSNLFKYLMKEGQKEIYNGWHWQWEFYKISVNLINDDATEKQLLYHLDEIENIKKIEDSWSSFGMPYIIDIKSKLIKKRHPKQYLDFLKEHKYIEAIRKELIAFYIKNKRWDDAELECDLTLSAELHINHADFLKLLLEVVRAKNNIDRELDCVVKLWRVTGNMDYYSLAKKLVDEDKWPVYLEKIIIKESKRRKSGFQSLFFSEPTVAEVYKREGWWDKLMALIETKSNLYLIESYRKELESRYKKRVFHLYKKEVYENLARVASRKNYQRQCRYLRRIKKLGFSKELEKIIIDLKKKYPQRRALIEELSTI